jgi:hypothetical protein
MSRGAAGASDSALSANLSILRNSIDLYQTEHGGTFPTLTQLNNGALTKYSDATGGTLSDTKTVSAIYGPYLRAVPTLPVGADKGKSTFIGVLTAGHGWVYDPTNGNITANCPDSEVDARGVKYNTY